MLRFCEGLPLAVFPFLTTQEIANLSCTCKPLHRVELPDGFWKRRVEYAAQLQPTLPEWLKFVRAQSHKEVACYLEKTRSRWRRGELQHTVYRGQVVPYNLRSFCIRWTVTPDKVVEQCFLFGFRTLSRDKDMPLLIRVRDQELLQYSDAKNATCNDKFVVQLGCSRRGRAEEDSSTTASRQPPHSAPEPNQHLTEFTCCPDAYTGTTIQLRGPAAKRIVLCDGFAVVISSDSAVAVALPAAELMGRPVPISLCTLSDHIHADGDCVVMLQSSLLAADILDCQVLRGNVAQRTLEHVVSFSVFPRHRRLVSPVAPGLVSCCTQGRLFVHSGRSRYLHVLRYETGEHAGCIPVSSDDDVALSSIFVTGDLLACGFANTDSGYNVRLYNWKQCQRLYSIRVCCGARLPRQTHSDPTLLASSIGMVKILPWQGLLLVETSTTVEVRDLNSGAELYKLQKRVNRMCTDIATCHNMLGMLFTVPVASLAQRQLNRRQYFLEAWRFDQEGDAPELSPY